ncbi:hypothetical protein H6G76_12940 [Nostoc sp. FACHB-152]|uniref:hypothetical protein n=1 Tax=unclassified Nostoc TaxID=2593658 RepID=UPI0016848E53|nr:MULTISPECIES: hypothetical protein [unclassified Nostoc]MBD2448057.1 hypothetical protein [Nostoc sp. FACHB-152]MBD2466164.1 hypothetical protein [Nostoc sp. FACHB-145]
MQYLYHLANASLTLRFVEYLISRPYCSQSIVTVISQVDGWIINIKMKSPLHPQQDGNMRAFLSELGVVYSPSQLINLVLTSLDTGASVVDVMHRYQVAIVSHGLPQSSEIEAFRQHFINGLGYCPQNLA